MPDHYGCDLHDPKDMALYRLKSGKVEKRCLACRRERNEIAAAQPGRRMTA